MLFVTLKLSIHPGGGYCYCFRCRSLNKESQRVSGRLRMTAYVILVVAKRMVSTLRASLGL